MRCMIQPLDDARLRSRNKRRARKLSRRFSRIRDLLQERTDSERAGQLALAALSRHIINDDKKEKQGNS